MIMKFHWLQFVVQAIDNGRPSKFSEATVTVFVSRIEPPKFEPLSPYEINIREDAINGTVVFTFRAVHNNQIVSIYNEYYVPAFFYPTSHSSCLAVLGEFCFYFITK